jgi:copper chaperone CopZ
MVMAASAGRTYDVGGMSCGHCARAVTGEVASLEGVARVEGDPAGLDAAAARWAIAAAGAEVAP